MLKKMLKVQVIGLLLIGANIQANSLVNCDELIGCEKKICKLEKELESAKKMNIISKVDGLETALDKVRKYCTNDKLIKDLKDKINDKKEDLAEHLEDYEKAVTDNKTDNKTDKIKKYESKMTEDKKEIKELQEELNTF
ncbi:hypothetical protein AN286_03485 [Aliarcobacter cryaerophilus ATCC 43158]|uniref:DUF1090 domain-containing protein n=1 Tax=Aliarcobacter cryaerophilus ATCC 43158 TaxID=1032070 RepID=A0A5B7X921_9BACT|nr:DUF1090 domain-containing protein [Aliarcobacter cryaerophilus]AYJ79242.1 DUF1090 domain-containing protein [Aliarcobacter cryaerophilus ATCC 43158]AYJ81033.1 DUF1090 domain-containing protein [Aliarcobacter cryaerophilus ATCC 43158]PRM93741.1 hypothetical protein CJ667_10335 [Aliarcobacter cryaerophilus]QCZ23352.1 hypothetical protein AN286_02635 [Aliarcobacter cryaerophilus ATCC 43158]QCZ23508.1 hypothetical protein AN286_03485 [Aliarcobacter cryaerophilus ATCC 43158]